MNCIERYRSHAAWCRRMADEYLVDAANTTLPHWRDTWRACAARCYEDARWYDAHALAMEADEIEHIEEAA